METKNGTVAIIGSGLAGMRAAQLLRSAGCSVTVFEKSRGTGGRLASSRLGALSADLGAPMIQATDEAFVRWLEQQGAQRWQPRYADFSLRVKDGPAGWVGVPRSSALTRQLAQGVALETGVRVGVVWPDREGVLLRDVEGRPLGHFDAVVVATPAPQAAPLLDAVQRFSQRAQDVPVAPIWTLLIELEQCPARLRECDWIEQGHRILQRAVHDSRKPGRSTDTSIWALQADPQWSAAQVDADPAAVAQTLLAAFEVLAGEALRPQAERVHRWLYGRADARDADAALWDEHNRIGACGDWLCGGDLQGAWRSATVLVEQMLQPDTQVA